MKPTHFIIQEKATINVEIEYIKEQTQNVVALLDNKSEQYIVIGAHYDHLGMGGYGSGSRRPDTVAVHNGADDNASGVSSVLEIAQKLSSLKNKLQKNVIFVAFTAEEMGLLGSTFFTNNSPVPIKNIDCMINLDMVGRIDSVEKKFTISGAGTAKELTDLINNLNLNQDYKFKLQNEGYGPSDHAPFYAKDIPVLFFFGKVHEDYHTPFDDIDKINFDGIKNVSDFITDLVVKLSSKEIDLTYQEAGPKEDTLSKKVSLKVTLGIMPDFTATDTKGVVAGAVTKGKPAYKAGMEKGDIIIALDGKPVDNIYEYMNRLNEFAKGQIITVDVIRNGEKKVLILQF